MSVAKNCLEPFRGFWKGFVLELLEPRLAAAVVWVRDLNLNLSSKKVTAVIRELDA